MTTAAQTDPDFERLLDYVKANRGFDFTGYKRPSLARRTRRRMQALGIDTYDAYLDYLESNPDEFAELFNSILINVTGFFRDGEPWEYIRDVIAPRIIDSKPRDAPVRVWCPGCATGEEPYTAAMVFAEVLGEEATTRLKVYATDVDVEALDKARHGAYTSKDVADVPERYREKYFQQEGALYTVDRELRHNVIFGRHDLVQDAPISRVDLLVCRNTLMYLNSETQNRVLENLNFALNDDGYLFLGKSEMLLTRPHLFTPVEPRRRVYQRVPRGELREAARGFRTGDVGGTESAELLRAAGFESGAPPQLVIDRNGTLALANQHARLLFGLALSDVGRPLQDLDVSYRPAELRSLIDRAYAEGRMVPLHDVAWDTTSGARVFEVQVTPLLSRGGDVLGASVVYLDVTSYRALQDQLEQSKSALEQAYGDIQSTNEELQTTNEELQSSNEELETTNEELQSTNEELETMNEELQSTNAELETMNTEFREQTAELNRVNEFLETILTGLGTAVVALDRKLRVLAWNATAEEMWGLKFQEVRGETFLTLDIGLPVEQLSANVRGCVGDGAASEVTIPAVNRRGKHIGCRVECKPLGDASQPAGVLLLLEELPPDGAA